MNGAMAHVHCVDMVVHTHGQMELVELVEKHVHILMEHITHMMVLLVTQKSVQSVIHL